jgi:hypothetical protein
MEGESTSAAEVRLLPSKLATPGASGGELPGEDEPACQDERRGRGENLDASLKGVRCFGSHGAGVATLRCLQCFLRRPKETNLRMLRVEALTKDALKGRKARHKEDRLSLLLRKLYHKRLWRNGVTLVAMTHMLLAVWEPASFFHLPGGVDTTKWEALILTVYVIDMLVHISFTGWDVFFHSWYKWEVSSTLGAGWRCDSGPPPHLLPSPLPRCSA